MTPSADPNPSTVRCGRCGETVPLAKFCNECGSPLASTVRCTSCGESVRLAKFCTECGASLTAAASASPAKPSAVVDPPAALPPAAPPPAAPPPVAPPPAAPGAVRAWLRSLDRGGVRSVGIRPDHVVEVAAALRVVRDERLLPDEAFKSLQNWALRFPGSGASAWTVGLGSLSWNMLRDGKWEPAAAPPWVWLEAPVRPRTRGERAAPAATPTCTQCGQALAPGRKFCTSCGTPVEGSTA